MLIIIYVDNIANFRLSVNPYVKNIFVANPITKYSIFTKLHKLPFFVQKQAISICYFVTNIH